MSSALVSTPDSNCCQPACEEVDVQNIPGPKGDPGQDGADGTDGINAYTNTTANFTMPAEGADVVVDIADSRWIGLNQILFVQSAGYMQAISLPSDTEVELRNLENTASSLYVDNAAPATIISSGVKVCPGGKQGPIGSAAGALLVANNLSDVPTPATARTNLGLVIGTNVQAQSANLNTFSGIAPAANVQSLLGAANYAAIRSLLSLVIGTNVQAWDADLDTYAGITPSANIQSLLGAANYAAARALLGVLPREGLLGSLIGADFNSTSDQAIAIASGVTRYVVRRIVVANASLNMTTAVGGVYGAAAKSAPVLVAATQVYTALTASGKYVDLTLATIVGTDTFSQTTLYLSLTTPQGVAATADVFIFGDNLT